MTHEVKYALDGDPQQPLTRAEFAEGDAAGGRRVRKMVTKDELIQLEERRGKKIEAELSKRVEFLLRKIDAAAEDCQVYLSAVQDGDHGITHGKSGA